MSFEILSPGPQTTLQAGGRTGYRHAGIPHSGPSDPLSHAVANHLVGNIFDAPAIEITYGPFTVKIHSQTAISLTGAEAPATLNGGRINFHETISVSEGDILEFGRPTTGLRTYLAVSGGFEASEFLGSQSTYLPAGFGGHRGRALAAGDCIRVMPPEECTCEQHQTPTCLRLTFTNSYALRSVAGPDYSDDYDIIWSEPYTATRRASRIGIELAGRFPETPESGSLPSAAIFPGALQLPGRGRGFLLLPDCQTTGGYPHLLQVSRSDRHLLGQIRPDDTLVFLRREIDDAHKDLKRKQKLISTWLPGFTL